MLFVSKMASFSSQPVSKKDSDLTFEFIKEKLDNGKIEDRECDATLLTFCSKLQLKTSGKKEELVDRLQPLKDKRLFD